MVLATLAVVAEVWEVLAKVLATPVWASLAAEVLEVEDWAQVMWAIQAVAMLVARVLGGQRGDQASADAAKLRPKDSEHRLELHGC